MTEPNPPQATSPPPKPKQLARWIRRIVIGLVVASLLGGGLVGVAEHHTSQPEFCASCHNMVPYYQSWQEDLHGGKLDVYCVDCHYAPGQKTTIKAKLRGLSQLASYFGGSTGVTRPRAQVVDESCLTSKCHGDLKFMDKKIQIGTVEFTHAHHLRRDPSLEIPNQERLAELQASLQELMGAEHFAELEGVAKQSNHAADRYAQLVALCREWNVDVDRETLVEFSQLHHRDVRISQLTHLQCANCHAYHSRTNDNLNPESKHFQVSTTTCFTCHFNNEAFNVGTNVCLNCHTPPQKEITIHAKLSPQTAEELSAPELSKETVKINHAELIERKVDCISCHADVSHDDAPVTRRDCERCHDQERFFENWSQPVSVDLVKSLHEGHIQQQRAKCLDCHAEIQHRVTHGDVHAGEFLSEALTDCRNCHPNHHREQVMLLMGQGGRGVKNGAPNPMFGARTNCYGCHDQHIAGPTGGEVVKATEKTCIACHSERYGNMLEKWKLGVEITLEDAEQAVQNAKQLLDEKTDIAPETRDKAAAMINLAVADLQLVKRGNGIHNVTYSIELLDAVTAHCRQATELLEGN